MKNYLVCIFCMLCLCACNSENKNEVNFKEPTIINSKKENQKSTQNLSQTQEKLEKKGIKLEGKNVGEDMIKLLDEF